MKVYEGVFDISHYINGKENIEEGKA